MDLTAYPTEMLLRELNSRGTVGIAALSAPGQGWVGVWWGDRVKCLGVTGRLTSLINADIDKQEDPLVDDEEVEESETLETEFPQMGQYL